MVQTGDGPDRSLIKDRCRRGESFEEDEDEDLNFMHEEGVDS